VIEVESPDGTGKSSFEAESGEILRKSLLKEKLELYQGWAKITNCNGGGTCGTCLVEITEDEAGLATKRTATEEKKLKGKKDSYRLACQTCIGDGCAESSGKVKVKLGPK
jgi:ferredoxin